MHGESLPFLGECGMNLTAAGSQLLAGKQPIRDRSNWLARVAVREGMRKSELEAEV